MANVLWQEYHQLPGQQMTLGVHRVKLTATNDSFTAALPAAHTTNSLSVAQLRDEVDPSVTVTQTAASATITLVGAKNNEITVVTLHSGVLNNLLTAVPS